MNQAWLQNDDPMIFPQMSTRDLSNCPPFLEDLFFLKPAEIPRYLSMSETTPEDYPEVDSPSSGAGVVIFFFLVLTWKGGDQRGVL